MCLPTDLGGFRENGNRHFLRLEKGVGSNDIRSMSLLSGFLGSHKHIQKSPCPSIILWSWVSFWVKFRLAATAVEPVIKAIQQILCSRRLLGCIVYKYICSYGKFWEKRWHLIPRRSSSCINLSGLMSLWLGLGYIQMTLPSFVSFQFFRGA